MGRATLQPEPANDPPVGSEARPRPRPGQIWRTELGGHPLYVVAVDDGFAYVRRADDSRASRARRAGAYLVAVSEFGAWTLLREEALDRHEAKTEREI